MAAEKITFEEFLQTVDPDNLAFVQNLHNQLLEQNCKAAFEQKKSGPLASYKFGKPPKALMNFVFRKQGMLTRIYGEHIAHYLDFLNTLPPEMVQHFENAGDCGRLVSNTCSTKCMGYDFNVGDAHFQKCRYNCFEFLMTEQSRPFIAQFIKHELAQRQ
ncbi:MAG: hypothetical protein FWD06_04640 [Oscillospiraceae bacterium]|nr:hypothetical protein [Oscillospiraceae bacterium]